MAETRRVVPHVAVHDKWGTCGSSRNLSGFQPELPRLPCDDESSSERDGSGAGDQRLLTVIKDALLQAIADPRLSRRHLRVLAEVADMVQLSSGVSHPGRRALSERTRRYEGLVSNDRPPNNVRGLSEASVAKTISELIGFGYLASARRQVEQGGRAIAHYAIVKPALSTDIPTRDRSRPRKPTEIAQRIAERRELRSRVVRAFRLQCEYCGVRQPDSSNLWHIDRIVPYASGGTYAIGNIALACGPCNIAKRDRDYIGPVRSLALLETGGTNAG